MIRDLATLLAPVSERVFLEHFLEKRRLHVKSSDPARAVSLLPWAEIDRLIQSDMLPAERLRVVRANVDLLPAMYRDSSATRRLRPRALQALLSQGASLIINGVSDLVPQIAYLSDAIERQLGHRAWVNAYLSFGRGSAFKAHWDHHDVLVVQAHGRKRWRSYGTPMPFPVETNGPSKPFGSEIVWEGLLEPGDVLYLPRGEVHEAALEEPHSVHLTIGIQAPCGIDLIRWMAEKAASDVLARMDLTRLGGEAALRAHETLLKERLHSLLDAISVADYLHAEDAKRKMRPLLSLGLADEWDADTMIVPSPRRPVPLAIESEGEVSVVIGEESYRLSTVERRVLDLLLTRNGLAFGDLVATLGVVFAESVLRKAVIDLAKQGLVGVEPSGAVG